MVLLGRLVETFQLRALLGVVCLWGCALRVHSLFPLPDLSTSLVCLGCDLQASCSSGLQLCFLSHCGHLEAQNCAR